MTAVVIRVELTEQPIELSAYEELVSHESAGAVVGFAGVVRDHDGGRTVTRLEYSAHPSAQQTLADVAATLEPHRLCGYLFSLAKAFTEFYEACSVINAESDVSRVNRVVCS